MKRSILLFSMISVLLISFSLFSAGTPGVIQGKTSAISPQEEEDAARTGPMAYDMKKLIGSIDTLKTVISTKWTAPTGYSYVCRGIYNSSGTAVIVNLRTTASSDTLPIAIGAYTVTPFTFPFIHTIFELNATDSLIVLLQITK